MIKLDLCGMLQEVDFASGEVGDFVILALPDGRRFKALVTKDVAQAVVSLAIPQSEVPSASEHIREEVLTSVFGGDVEPEVPQPPTDKPKKPGRRTVIKDDMGYPVVLSADSVDPATVLGGTGTDEDEAGQI